MQLTFVAVIILNVLIDAVFTRSDPAVDVYYGRRLHSTTGYPRKCIEIERIPVIITTIHIPFEGRVSRTPKQTQTTP